MSNKQRVLTAIMLLTACACLFASAGCDQISDAIDKQWGWENEERREKDPVGYLEFAEGELKKDVARIGTLIRDLHRQRGELESLNSELTHNNAAYGALLDEGRALYRRAEEAEGGYPVEFRGAKYTRDEFFTQMEIILNQHDLTKGRLEQLAGSLKALSRHVTTLHAERAKAQGVLEDIRTAIVIARVEGAIEDVRRTMNRVEAIRISLGAVDVSSPIRAPDDMIPPPTPKASRQELMKFLEGDS